MATSGGREPDAKAQRRRARMVEIDIAARGITDERLLAAFGAVPREAFVPDGMASRAYDDRALPIAAGQTISQPYVVALMLDALELQPDDRLLEVGSGSGYAAAVAARLCAEVIGVERMHELVVSSQRVLDALGVAGVTVVEGDGSVGWPAGAPYDAILVSAGAPDVPAALVEQLAPGGRLVLPAGRDQWGQRLLRVRRTAAGTTTEDLGAVAFVPLIGAQGWRR